MKRLNVSDLIDQAPIKHSIRETDTEYVEEVADGEFALDMERIVADVLNSGARVAPDLRIDDRDLKEFPNFYEWCFSKDGGNQAPFAKQLALATHLLAEYCVSGNSWLHTNKGMVRIKDLVPKPGLNPIKAKVTARNGIRKVTFGGLTKRQAKTLKITYSNGMFIEVTPEHKVLVATSDHTFKWVRAKNLSVGDYGVIPLGHDLWSKKDCILPRLHGSYHKSTRIYKTPSKMTPDLARLIGYHLTNGSKSEFTIDFCTPDVNVMQDYRATFKKVFGVKPQITRSYITSKGDKYQECAVNSRYLSDWFDLIGLTGICYNKFIPDCVLQSSKSCITNLLRGIFDCDGYIDCTKDVTRLGIKLANTNLCYQIFMLLINLGIYSVYAEEIRTDNTDKVERKYGTIWVRTPEAWAKYKETIGSIHIKKSKALEELATLSEAAFTNTGYGNLPPKTIPYINRSLLGKIKQLGLKPLRNVYHYRGSAKLLRTITAEMPEFFEYAEALVKPQKFVKSVVSNNLVFSQIASISEGGVQDVYDITVPKGENFICNGIVVHNCPRCSHKAFRNIHKIPVNFPAKDFPDKVQFLYHGVCPKCGARKSELVKSGELNAYVELDVCAGQRSGKSAFFNLLVPYLTHKWVKVEKPVETLGLMSSSILIGTCTALTWAKAQELLYDPISNAIENSKWFQQYFQLLDDYEERTGIELYKFKDTFLSFNHKNLILNTSGPNKRTLRGATRWISVIDEIGWFPHGDDNDERERASANEVYVSLDRSLKTVRKSTMKLLKEGYDSIPLAYGCGISSPSSYNDKIMELVRNFKGSKEVLVHQAPTWEMNPLFTKEDFAKEYQDDPIKAERDFGANPPMAENAWISDVKSLDHLLVNRWVIDYQYDHFTNRSGVDMVFGKLRSTKAPPTCPPTVLTIDAGYSNNSFALAITANDGRGANVLAVAEIAPKKGITVINYTRTVKQLLYPLIKAFNVQAVGADRWNSLKLLQDIEEDCHVQTFQYSLKPTDFDLVYDYLMEDIPAIKLPRPEMDLGQIFVTSDYPHGFKYKPNSHLYHQFSTVNVDGRGSVEKGNGYTDDILRAVALGIRTCVLEDTIKKFNLKGATKQTRYAIGARSGSAQATSSSTIGSKTGSSGSGSFGSRG